MFAVTVCTWPAAIEFEPKEMKLNASFGFTVKLTVLEYAFCDELSVIITLAYNLPVGPVELEPHVNDADRFWLVIAFAPTIELVE